MKNPPNKRLTTKQIEALSRLSKLLNKPIPKRISTSSNPKLEANRVLNKWGDEWGRAMQIRPFNLNPK